MNDLNLNLLNCLSSRRVQIFFQKAFALLCLLITFLCGVEGIQNFNAIKDAEKTDQEKHFYLGIIETITGLLMEINKFCNIVL